ncbi:hypothetical protein [Candidatus Laterigemmans baculatus]|uniref:hypothetical protein n=1 Tax=Candidatus Laterigemmans baculatus TaxID=2770505 RepID=UPI001F284E6C|nr:hypothetical protein [Candidatus Laterigemmans baculatus]
MDARWSTLSCFSFFFFLAALAAVPAAAAFPASAMGSASAMGPGGGRSARTANFIIQAATPELAQQVGQEAERFRSELAQQWLGRDLPQWSSPCTLKVVAGNYPAQGVTTYNRYPGHVGDFQMEVVGTPQRILDSVLPHEVTHAVLATHFGRPLPRWADEGVSTTVEHPEERAKHDAKLREFLSTRRGLPMNRMFLLKDYPSDMLPLYAQGYSVSRFLIEQNGHREFIKFIEDYMERGSWTAVVEQHYGYESLGELQEYWLNWVADGSGPVDRYTKHGGSAPATAVAAATQGPATPPSMIRNAGLQTPAGNGRSGNGMSGQGAGSQGAGGPVASVASLQGSAGEGGWYLRRRQEVQAGGTPAAPASLTTPPPSGLSPSGPAAARLAEGRPQPAEPVELAPAGAASPYSVSQPQPEQGATQSAPAGPAARWSPGGDTKWR